MVIEGKVIRCLGMASQLGFPTINIDIRSTDCGVYQVEHDEYGGGVAFVMPNLTELHFLREVDFTENHIACRVVTKIEPPENGILDYFYRGIKAYEDEHSTCD